MLTLVGQPFASGRSRFFDRAVAGEESTSKIYVKIRPEGLDVPVLAQLDTGSPWSILSAEIADVLGLLDATGIPTRLHTRLGTRDGHLERVQMVLPADEGQSLRIEAMVFICEDWVEGNFIGYTGFVDAIRTALDPQNNLFYFGSY
jgi:hypothetical protein